MGYIADFFETNLTALRRYHPKLAESLSMAKRNERFSVVLSKTGKPVPSYSTRGSALLLNSKYDPEKEADRFASAAAPSQSYLVLGLDGGYSLHKLLNRRAELVIVVDFDIGYLRFLLEQFDFAKLLLDPRFKLIIRREVDEIAESLLNTYMPLFHGNLTVVPQRARVQINEPFFSQVRSRIPNIIGLSTIDISTQKRFARRWMQNIMANSLSASASAQKSYVLLPSSLSGDIHITAAGPSLEASLSSLRALPDTDRIAATDTSLPLLLSADIIPDFVVSVDCQHHSYHHFLSGIPARSILVLDLVSHPQLFRCGNRIVPIAGGHPFSTYISRHFYPFIRVDTSGGNVTHAAVSFADRLNPRRIILHGADFSYPDGKLYARQTYLHTYFSAKETRLCSLETAWARMLLDKGDLILASAGGRITYTTGLLESYREKLTALAGDISTPVYRVDSGIPIRRGKNTPVSLDTTRKAVRASLNPDWLAFCRTAYDELSRVRLGNGPVHSIIENLDSPSAQLLLSIMPLAAHHFEKYGKNDGIRLLETAISEARMVLRRTVHGI